MTTKGRIPINIWGDVLLDGQEPVIRRVLTGQDAHECMYAWVYLNEFLVLSEMVQSARKEMPKQADIPARFEALRAAADDAQSQIGMGLLQTFLPLALYLHQANEEGEFVELGSTLFSSLLKLEIAAKLMELPLNFDHGRFCAIDYSRFLQKAARFLHGSQPYKALSNIVDWTPSAKHPVLLSRFVSSYAVPNAAGFVDWVDRFSAFYIEDPISGMDDEFETENHGLRQVFFSLPALVGGLEARGWTLYLSDITPEWYDGGRRAVVRLFGVKHGAMEFQHAWTKYQDVVPLTRLTAASVNSVIEQCFSTLSDAQWEALAAYKRHFPIWGQPFPRVKTVTDVEALIEPPKGNLQLTFAGGAIHAMMRRALGEW